MTTRRHKREIGDRATRVKRPPLDRDGPIRSWAAAANPNPQSAAGGRQSNREVPVDHQDPVVRGVVAGGRVVDEWIRQAEQTARLLGGTRSTAGWTDASGQMFKTASDIVAAWWSLFGVTAPNAVGGFGSRRPGTAGHESAWAASASAEPMAGEAEPASSATSVDAERVPQSSAGPRVRLEIASRRPVDVTVDLRRRGSALFRVLDLRSQSGDAARIQGTTLEAWDTEGVRLRLAVPDDQPPGTYHGVILDPVLDSAVGTVTLRIPE